MRPKARAKIKAYEAAYSEAEVLFAKGVTQADADAVGDQGSAVTDRTADLTEALQVVLAVVQHGRGE